MMANQFSKNKATMELSGRHYPVKKEQSGFAIADNNIRKLTKNEQNFYYYTSSFFISEFLLNLKIE